MLEVLKLLLPRTAKAIWKVMDGKKTVSGGVLTAAGIGMLFIPGGQKDAAQLLALGVPMLVVGIGHKVQKRKKKRPNRKEVQR